MGRATSLNRFDPKYASFGPRAPRSRPAAPPSLASFSPAPKPDKPIDKYSSDKYEKYSSDKYVTVTEKHPAVPERHTGTLDRERTIERTIERIAGERHVDRHPAVPERNTAPLEKHTERHRDNGEKYTGPDKYAVPDKHGDKNSGPDKYATVRPARRAAEPQPLSAAALEYRSLQRPRRQQQPNTNTTHRRRPERQHPQHNQQHSQQHQHIQQQHDHRDLYAVTEL